MNRCMSRRVILERERGGEGKRQKERESESGSTSLSLSFSLSLGQLVCCVWAALPAHGALALGLQRCEHDDDRVVPGRSLDETPELVAVHPDDGSP